MNIAISGSHGFIGSNIKKNQKYGVIAIPRDVLYFPHLLKTFFQDYPVDYIIHLASYGNMSDQKDFMATIEANILGISNMLYASQDLSYKGFINVSSSSVGLPYETLYSATKGGGERIVKAYVNETNKPVVNVRPFSVIGVGEQDAHLIPKLIESSLIQKRIQFVTDPVHDFIGIDDFCDALIRVMEHAEELKGKTIDIGTGSSYTNQYVLNVVEKVTDKKANVEIVSSMRPYDTGLWNADIRELQKLGWKQKDSLEDVIRRMVDVKK